MKKNLLTLMMMLCAYQLIAQPYKKTYGGTNTEYVNDIVDTRDGGQLLVGDTYSFGVFLTDMLFVKTNSSGDVLWSKTFGTSGYDYCNAVVETKDGGFAVAGTSNNRMTLIKMDGLGNVQWVKYYTANSRQSASTLVQTADGGFALAGQVATNNNGSWGYLVRTDSTGDLLWSKLIFQRNFYPEIIDMVTTTDGGFALAAIFPTPAYYDMYLIKLNSAGNFEWGRSIGGESSDVPSFVKQTSDGGYLMGGFAFSFASPVGQNMFVYKTTSNGTLQWAKDIGTVRNETFSDAMEIPGGFVILGSTDSASNFIRRSMLVRIKSNGVYQGARILNELDETGISAISNFTRNGFSIAGTYGAAFNLNADMYVARFNNKGVTCGSFSSFGTVKDTGTLVTQVIPVTNANTVVTNGTEGTVVRTVNVTTLCGNAVSSTETSDISKNTTDNKFSFKLSPNPATNQVNFNWNAVASGEIHASILSFDGKLQYVTKLAAMKGHNTFTVPLNKLLTGMYVLKINDGKTQRSATFFKR